jgi:hypothetical protein
MFGRHQWRSPNKFTPRIGKEKFFSFHENQYSMYLTIPINKTTWLDTQMGSSDCAIGANTSQQQYESCFPERPLCMMFKENNGTVPSIPWSIQGFCSQGKFLIKWLCNCCTPYCSKAAFSNQNHSLLKIQAPHEESDCKSRLKPVTQVNVNVKVMLTLCLTN